MNKEPKHMTAAELICARDRAQQRVDELAEPLRLAQSRVAELTREMHSRGMHRHRVVTPRRRSA